MTDLAALADVLPKATTEAWPSVASVAPADAVLMGGTALAIHLHHRVSRDLDIFTTDEFDPDEIEARLRRLGLFATTLKGEGTLNGVFNEAKVQFLWAREQRTLEAPTPVAGLPVGSLSDLFATKLKVIADRGELRDYFDLMTIETRAGRRAEEGLALYLHRYGIDETHPTVEAIVRGLGFLDDVNDDPHLTREHGHGIRASVASYWAARQQELIAHLDPGHPPPSR